jgi:hypothetical protein
MKATQKEVERLHPRGQWNLATQICGVFFPTPNAGTEKWRGQVQELGGSGNPFRGEPLGKLFLNPCFLEWMNGVPITWTDLKPLETDKFQSVQHTPGDCFQEWIDTNRAALAWEILAGNDK